jgi:hypothetical protein
MFSGSLDLNSATGECTSAAQGFFHHANLADYALKHGYSAHVLAES